MIRYITITGKCISHTWFHIDTNDTYQSCYLVESYKNGIGGVITVYKKSVDIPKSLEGKVIKAYCFVLDAKVRAMSIESSS